MNALNSKRLYVFKFFSIVFGLSGLSNAYAQSHIGSGNHDGGLMKQMINEKYLPQVITDPDAQARLHQVVIAEPGHQNGGLMKQMTPAKYQPKDITDPDAQARLRQVVIAEPGHQNGGLMKQMREQMMQAEARYPDQIIR